MIMNYNISDQLSNKMTKQGKTGYLGATPVYRTKVNCKQTKWPHTLESSTDKRGYNQCYLFIRDVNNFFFLSFQVILHQCLCN